MKMEKIGLTGLLIGAAALLTACTHTPMAYKSPISATPPTGQVAVSQAVNILDASDSGEMMFAESKSTFESVVGVMPDGDYSAGQIVFGGFERDSTEVMSFDRDGLEASAKDSSFLGGATQIFEVIDVDLTESIGEAPGRAAIVLISDGLATDYVGRSDADGRTLDAARSLVASRDGDTCFHTIQTGNDPAGAALLQELAGVSGCGTFRNASALGSAAALTAFSEEVYIDVTSAETDRDADGDGVLNSVDACPNTLRDARVDSRGCWTLRGIRFASNSADLAGDSTSSLKEDLDVLRANPNVRIRIDGHTDSDGAAEHNVGLSERRAAAVRDYFVEKSGLAADRFDIKGFGESDPIAANDSSANKRKNRRVELTIVD